MAEILTLTLSMEDLEAAARDVPLNIDWADLVESSVDLDGCITQDMATLQGKGVSETEALGVLLVMARMYAAKIELLKEAIKASRH